MSIVSMYPAGDIGYYLDPLWFCWLLNLRVCRALGATLHSCIDIHLYDDLQKRTGRGKYSLHVWTLRWLKEEAERRMLIRR